MKIGLAARTSASMTVLAAMATPTMAWAADTASTATGGLEEIVVTAQQRPEPLQDTALSITAFSARDLADAGVGRIEDLAGFLPNVYLGPRDLRTSAIAIRGISADLNNPGLDQSVGVYVDGVYMGRAATINSNLFDLERVEVLRGPQGTLYGRNTVAGAVNFITRKPDADPRAEASVSYGNYDAVRANALASGPLAQSLYGSMALSIDRRDGFVRNTATNTRLDNVNGIGGRLTLVYAPGETWDLTLRGDISRDRTHSGAFDILDNGAFAGTPLADADPYDRTVAQSTNTTQNRDVYGGSIELNWHLGGGTLTAISALRGYKWDNVQDNDYTALDLLDTGISERQTQFSQEVRYASDPAARLSYVVGGYYFYQRLKTRSTVFVGTDLGIYPTRESAVIAAGVDTNSFAAFSRLVYRIADTLSLAGGLRYTHETKKLDFAQTGDPYGVIAGDIPARTIHRAENKVTPSVTLEWRPRHAVLAYATFSQGYKSGGFNVFSVTSGNDAEYRPENVFNYEIGFKSEFLGGKLRVNASAFYMDYRDLQQNQLIMSGGGIAQYQTSNAAKARSKGFELEIAAAPSPRLQATATYGYVDAAFKSYPNATPAGADYSGNRLPLAPRHSASAAVEWRPALTEGLDLFLRGEVTHRSRIYFASDNAYSDGALTLLNARIGFGPDSGAWRASVWGRNLANETYAINRVAGAIVPLQVVQALGAPRTYGVELNVRF